MGHLINYVQMAQSQPLADFVVVYVAEAHPTDGWMYPAVEHHVKQHTVMKDRVEAASVLAKRLCELASENGTPQIPLYADTMGDSAAKGFGALPERLAIIHNGQVVFIGGKGPEAYSIPEVKKALVQILS